jgi:hypothetical protein
MTSEKIQESILRYVASSPQGRSAIDIVRFVANKEKVSPDLVSRELLNLMERGDVGLRTNLKLERAERQNLVDHPAQ